MSYPVVLNVQGKNCLVVGGGKVGSRKARGLYEEGAQVTVLSSSFYERLEGVRYIEVRYDAAYLDEIKPWLVVTCTDDGTTNAQIQADAKGAIIIRADDSKAGDAHGLIKREMGAITITASTGVPTLSRYLLNELEAWLSPEMLNMTAELQTIRAELKERLATAEARSRIWRAIEEEYPRWLAARKQDATFDLQAEVEKLVRKIG